MPDSVNETDFANDDHGSSRLISADKVHGTEVYNHAGDRLGSVDSIMLDKFSGKIAYVVMSFGGFLGIGEKYHPLPWDVLDYDPGIGGYRVGLDRESLVDAPAYDRADIDTYDYNRNAADIDGYYAGTRRPGFDGPDNCKPGFYSSDQQQSRNVGSADENDAGDTTADLRRNE